MSTPLTAGTPPRWTRPAVLVEALPWLERFHGKTVVVKYGGNAMTDEALQRAFAEDVVFLRLRRPAAGRRARRRPADHRACSTGSASSRSSAAGHRVTTPETMDVVRMVLVGQVQREIVGLINAHGPFAVGLSGEDAHLFTAEPQRRRRRRRAGRHRPGRRRRRASQPGVRRRACSTTA